MAETTRGAAAAARLDAATAEMIAEAERLPAGLPHWRPAEGVWSVMEILCHVDEFIPYWTGQALQIISDPARTWGRTHSDTSRLDAVGRADARTLSDVLASLKNGARQSGDRLKQLKDADLDVEATSTNPRWGTKPASFVVDQLIVEHVEKHIGQIRRNVQQYEEKR